MTEYVRQVVDAIDNVERVSNLAPTTAENHSSQIEYDHRSVTEGWVRDSAAIEIELVGDRVSRIEFLDLEVIAILDQDPGT